MAYKFQEVETTIGAAVPDAFSMFEELATEMRETADNMEGANMGHMQKCEDAGTAADELENHTELDVPSHIANVKMKYTEMVNKKKRRGPSRSVRLSNAQAMMQSARDAAQAFADAADANAEDLDNLPPDQEGTREEVLQFIADLDEHCEFDVEFPGMFG
jgi:hypothetical protein